MSVRQSLLDFKNDLSLSHLVVSLIVVIIGISSSTVLIFEAAKTLGLSLEAASSWLGSLCVGMGALSIFLSFKFKIPILIAWSTAGAALLITSLPGMKESDAIGAFLMGAVLTFVISISGLFEKILNKIPQNIASALLAGTLLHFALNAFGLMSFNPLLVIIMLFTYVFAKKQWPQFTMLFVLLSGLATTSFQGHLNAQAIQVHLMDVRFTTPTFSLLSFVSISLPLFIITMASQNITGLTLIRSNGFNPAVSKIMSSVSFANILTSFFGGFTLNLSALSSAIALGPDSHPESKKRYISAIITGALYMFIGVFSGTIASLFAAFPEHLIKAIAGFALLNTIFGSLRTTFDTNSQNDAAFLTFIISAANFKFLSIGSSFWGLAAGLLIHWIQQKKASQHD